MGATNKSKNDKIKKFLAANREKPVINPNMPDFSNDPYFVKKVEDMKRLLDECGWPE
jgi:hypothetical protein